MTIGTDRDVDPAARQWAAELLGVDPTATPAEARRAFFKKLRESDFLPPQSWQCALRLLDPKPGRTQSEEQWLAAEEERLRTEIETFAVAFFTLSASERRQRWNSLRFRSADFPAQMNRLQALSAGLDVEPPPSSERSFQGDLVAHLIESFPLPLQTQVKARQAFLRRIEDSTGLAERPMWEQAARYLLAEWPTLAALDQELVVHVSELSNRLKRRQKTHQRLQRKTQPVSSGGEWSTNYWWVVVAIAVIGACFRGAGNSGNSNSSRSPSYYYPSPPPPPDLSHLKDLGRINGDDLRTGTPALPFSSNIPPMHELMDPTKYDAEVVNPSGARVLRFTPRRVAAPGVPLHLGEATLRLQGISREEVDALFARVAARQRPSSDTKRPQR